MIQMDKYESSSAEMVPILRAMTPAKRLGTALYLAQLARKMMFAQTASAHPDWSSEQVREDVARRILRGAK